MEGPPDMSEKESFLRDPKLRLTDDAAPTSAPPCRRRADPAGIPGRAAAPRPGRRGRGLGPEGRPLIGEVGELVITETMPSMPLYLWGDEDSR